VGREGGFTDAYFMLSVSQHFRLILRLKSGVWGLFLFMPEGRSAQLVGAGSRAIVPWRFCRKVVAVCMHECVCVCVCDHGVRGPDRQPSPVKPAQCWKQANAACQAFPTNSKHVTMFMLLLLLNLHQQGNFKWPSILFVIFFLGGGETGV
jgi:hypothetical protein